MSENQQETKIMKWVKNASQYKLGKITENKKYSKDLQNQQTVDIDEFMIELETIEAKSEKTSKLLKNAKTKAKNQKQKEKQILQENEIPKEKEIERQKEVEKDANQKDMNSKDLNQRDESQKGEKQNSIRQRGESISDLSMEHKVMIIEDDSEKKQSDQEEEKIQKKVIKKIIIPKKQNGKDKLKLVCDVCVQTDDTSDVHGYDILKLIQLEQHFVFALHNFHEKLLKLLDNQI